MIQMNLQNRERLADLADKLTVARGEGIARALGKVVCILLSLRVDNQQGPAV